jgi:hypothetical protein
VKRRKDCFDCFVRFSLPQHRWAAGYSDLIEPRAINARMAPNRFPIDIERIPDKFEGNKRVMFGAQNPVRMRAWLSERVGGHELLIASQRDHEIRESRRFQLFG